MTRGWNDTHNSPICIELHQYEVRLVDGLIKVLLCQLKHDAFSKMMSCLLLEHIVNNACIRGGGWGGTEKKQTFHRTSTRIFFVATTSGRGGKEWEERGGEWKGW